MTDVEDRGASALAAEAAAVLEPVFVRLDRLRRVVLTTRPPDGGWAEGQLDEAHEMILQLLAEDPVHVGMGFVGEPGAVGDQDRYMLWWQLNGGRTSRLRLNFDRSSIDVYDYAEMDWFTLPRAGHERVTFGPYVDYSGSELYVVTATMPVTADGVFVGVVGADLLFGELERRLLAVLREASLDAVLVNAERRVVSANSPRWIHGTRLNELPRTGEQVNGVQYVDSACLPDGTGWFVGLAEREAR